MTGAEDPTHFRDLLLLHQRLFLRRDGPLALLGAEGGGSIGPPGRGVVR